MKIIVENATRHVKYAGADYVLEVDKMLVLKENGSLDFTVWDLNENTATEHEVSVLPEGWAGNKYLFVDNTFELNPDFTE